MGYMLSPEYGDLLMEEYMGDTEDPQTNRAQFQKMKQDNILVTPALQAAHFHMSTSVMRHDCPGSCSEQYSQMSSVLSRPIPAFLSLSVQALDSNHVSKSFHKSKGQTSPHFTKEETD
jgi:hypothetical protein